MQPSISPGSTIQASPAMISSTPKESGAEATQMGPAVWPSGSDHHLGRSPRPQQVEALGEL
jgi:hypothetical protein